MQEGIQEILDEFQDRLEVYLKKTGNLPEDHLLADWVIIGSATNLDLMDRQATYYFTGTRQHQPNHVTLGLAEHCHLRLAAKIANMGQ